MNVDYPASARSERGSALITVLMLVASMSLVAVGISQAVNAASIRSASLSQQTQARLYSYSAEAVIKARFSSLMQQYDGRVIANAPGFSEPIIYPIEGGTVTVLARDHSNCFNLNAMVTRDNAGRLVSNPQGEQDFITLTESAGLDRTLASSLASALIDWVDSDSMPNLSGAEDAWYSGQDPAYRTSGQPLTTRSEINMIRGFDPNVRLALRPYICALPDEVGTGFGPLNINTITVDQAGLLQLALSDALSLNDAKTLISSRPVRGWESVDAFLEEPKVAEIAASNIQRNRLSVRSTHISALAEISYRDQSLTMEYLLSIANGEVIKIIRRERVS